MTPSKWLLSGLALLLGGAWLCYLFYREPEPAPVTDSRPLPPPAAPPASAPAPSAKRPELEEFRAGVPMKRVMELYQRESQRIGRVDKDPKGTRARLEESAKELSPEEIAWLERQALDPKSDMDARFFASYLIGLSGRAESLAALRRIALNPIPPSKNPRVVEEQRALRAQAVEGMCTRQNCRNELAEQGLLEVVSYQQDEFLRDRAHRCLFACRTGKSPEAQDEEALGRLRGR